MLASFRLIQTGTGAIVQPACGQCHPSANSGPLFLRLGRLHERPVGRLQDRLGRFHVGAGDSGKRLAPTSNIKSDVRSFTRLFVAGVSINAAATSAAEAGATASTILRDSSSTTLSERRKGGWFVLRLLGLIPNSREKPDFVLGGFCRLRLFVLDPGHVDRRQVLTKELGHVRQDRRA